MFLRVVFWPWLAGLLFLVAGLFLLRRELARAAGLEKLIASGPVLVAASIAVFGAEHLVIARQIMQLIPAWIPAHLFWAYLVGFALLAAAASFIAGKWVKLSASLLGVMIFLFVFLLHAPRIAANPRDRISWAVGLRDLAFAGGAWALAGTGRKAPWMIAVGRFTGAIALLFFAAEHFLHPRSAPGVPLAKLTPAWVPAAPLWGYLTGAILLAAGIALFLGRRARPAAAIAGLAMVLLTFFLYLPILLAAEGAGPRMEGLNYVADTLLFGGTLLVLSRAMPRRP